MLIQRDVYIVPTFSVYFKMKETRSQLSPRLIDMVKRAWDVKMGRFVEAYKAGVKIAAGSDNGSPTAPHADITTELESSYGRG